MIFKQYASSNRSTLSKNSSKILTQEPFLGREMERLSRSIVKEVISFDSRLFI